MTPDTERCEWCGQPWTTASRLQGWCERCGCDIDRDYSTDEALLGQDADIDGDAEEVWTDWLGYTEADDDPHRLDWEDEVLNDSGEMRE